MAREIRKGAEGKYSVWSTIVDGYIIENATPEQIIEMFTEEAREEITQKVMGTIERLG